MRGFPPNQKIWKRINKAIMGENAADVLSTMISGICAMLVQAGVAQSENMARVHLAAMLLSPDDGDSVGSLMPLLNAEFARLDDGHWRR